MRCVPPRWGGSGRGAFADGNGGPSDELPFLSSGGNRLLGKGSERCGTNEKEAVERVSDSLFSYRLRAEVIPPRDVP